MLISLRDVLGERKVTLYYFRANAATLLRGQRLLGQAAKQRQQVSIVGIMRFSCYWHEKPPDVRYDLTHPKADLEYGRSGGYVVDCLAAV